jgi:ribose transport system permease protein
LKARSALVGAGGPAIGLVVLCIALSTASPYFFISRNPLDVVDQATILGTMAVGMTLVLIIGGIELSVARVLALPMMVLGWTTHNVGWPFGLGVLAALVTGAA